MVPMVLRYQLVSSNFSLGNIAYPSSSLLEMADERLGNRAELQRLVDVRSSPSSTQQHARRADVFGERTRWEAAKFVNSCSSDGIS